MLLIIKNHYIRVFIKFTKLYNFNIFNLFFFKKFNNFKIIVFYYFYILQKYKTLF